MAKILDDGGGVTNGLLFTEMQVENNDDAYMLFEILNGRGVELTGADLVKNYLFLRAAEKGSNSRFGAVGGALARIYVDSWTGRPDGVSASFLPFP